MAADLAILDRLEHSGRRRTTPRKRVVAAALRRRKPFTALELFAGLRRHGVGRATVFRTLELLVDIGALSRVHGIESGQRCVRYTPCASAHHHHLVCQVCGRVDEIAAGPLDGRIAAAARARGFRPIGHTVEIQGVCPDCRR